MDRIAAFDTEDQGKLDVLHALRDDVARNLPLLATPEQLWQPTDLLPDLTSDAWAQNVSQFRSAAAGLSDEFLVVLVGGMVTEEALPNYSVSLNRIVRDDSGRSMSPWAQWLRGWTAEENRHGDLLAAYLRLTGRVNIRSVETSVYHLLRNGFDPNTTDPYGGIIYTAFQERATKITHANVGRLAGAQGDDYLMRICQRIAADESRHETFYTRIMGRVMDEDPSAAILSFQAMLRTAVAMPGRLMYDGRDPDLFDHFASVAQRIGAYTVTDYAQIIGHLVNTWDVAGRSVSGAAAKAQEYLCRQPGRYGAICEAMQAQAAQRPKIPFDWISGRTA